MTDSHWLTKYDPNDGEPYGTVCHCDIGEDHDGTGAPMFATDQNDQSEEANQ